MTIPPKFTIEAVASDRLVALRKTQPLDHTKYYTYAVVKVVKHEVDQDSRSGEVSYKCVCIDVKTCDIYRDIYLGYGSAHRLANREEYSAVGMILKEETNG